MKKTTLALSIITAFGLWGCVGSSSGDDQPIDQGHSQQQHHINPSQNTDNNNNDNGNSENAGSTSGSAGGAAGHVSGGSTGGQPIADNDSSDDDKTGGNDDDHDDHSVSNELDALVQLSDEALQKETDDNSKAKETLTTKQAIAEGAVSSAKEEINKLNQAIKNANTTLDSASSNDAQKAAARKVLAENPIKIESYQAEIEEENKTLQELAKKILENGNQGINLKAAKDIKENNKFIDEAKKDQPQSFINIKNAENAKIRAQAAHSIAEKNKTYAENQKIAANTALNNAIAAQKTALEEKAALSEDASEEAKKAANEKLVKAKEAVTKAQQEKATAEQKLAEESAKEAKAKEEFNTAKADVEKAKELDQNRGVAGEVPSSGPLSVFTSVSQVTREGNHSNDVWNITFKDGETLSINPAVAWSNNKIGERKDSDLNYGKNYNEHYFGNIGKQDGKNLAIVARADSVYGYYGDKFFAVGTVTPKEKIPKQDKLTYLGSAFLKADDGTDLVSKVSATADWANKKLTGSFSDFKSYKPDDVVNGAVSKGASNVAAYDKLGNEVEFAKATIDGNRFYSSVDPKGTTANVYGYFYGVEPTSNVGSHKNGGEIAGLVQYSKFHGAFGAKHFDEEKKNTSGDANTSGSSTADTNTASR